MKTTKNKIRQELKAIADAHGMVNSFFWGDPIRAWKENIINYPLVCCWSDSGSLANNTTDLQFQIVVMDKHYKDWKKNINDVESDVVQIARHFFNVINKSPRWQKIGKLTSNVNIQSFRDDTGDEVAGVQATFNLKLRDSSGLCDLPIFGYDYGSNGGGDVVCLDATFLVEYENGTLIESGTIPSGGDRVVTVPNPPVVGDVTVNINGDEWGVFESGTTENIQVRQSAGSTQVGAIQGAHYRIADSSITVNNAPFTTVRAEATRNITLTDQLDNVITPLSLTGNTIQVNIPEAVLLPSGTYTPKNVVSGVFDLLWEGATANMTTGAGFVTKTGADGWDGSAFCVVQHVGDFTMNFHSSTIADSGYYSFGLSYFKVSNSWETINQTIYHNASSAPFAYENTTFRAVGSTTLTDNIFSIRRTGLLIEWLENGIVFYSRTLPFATFFLIDMSIYSSITLDNIQIIIP